MIEYISPHAVGQRADGEWVLLEEHPDLLTKAIDFNEIFALTFS